MPANPRRDDFSTAVIGILAQRVGLRCSKPECRQLTSGPRLDTSKAVNVGVAAHITAASPGGPRFDPTLSVEQRASAENGIWLCQNHAKLIDNDAGRYPADLLRQWKKDAEETAHQEVSEGQLNRKQHPDIELSLRVNVDTWEVRSNVYWRLKNNGEVAARQYQVIIHFPYDLHGRPFSFDDSRGLDARLQHDDADSPIYWRLVISNPASVPIFPGAEAAGNFLFRQALAKSPPIPTISEIRFQIFADDMPTKAGAFALAEVYHSFDMTPKQLG